MRKGLLCLAMVLAAPVPAHAATVRGDVYCPPTSHYNFDCVPTVIFTAAPGETNEVSAVVVDHETLEVRDGGAPITPGAGCVAIAGGARCTNTIEGFPGPTLYASLGDGDDTSTADGQIDGGSGDDMLRGTGTLTGGPGKDVIVAIGRSTLIDGDGRQAAHDVYQGNGTAALTYGARTSSVLVDLRPGHHGEDSISGVTGITGGYGNDTLIGDDKPNTLNGGPGDDHVLGMGGDDNVAGGVEGIDVVDGGEGDDLLSGSSVDSTLRCGAGSDQFLTYEGRVAGDCERDGGTTRLRTTLASATAAIMIPAATTRCTVTASGRPPCSADRASLRASRSPTSSRASGSTRWAEGSCVVTAGCRSGSSTGSARP